jgi:hypothetical protein
VRTLATITITQTKTGTAIITAGNISVTTPHGLAVTPTLSDIQISTLDDLGGKTSWPSNPTATEFTINISSMDPDVDHQFSWMISYLSSIEVGSSIPGGTYYVTVAFVRNVSGLTTREKSDDNINDFISVSATLIDTYCERTTPFPSDDVNYKKVQYACALLVAWMAYRSLIGAEQKAKAAHDEAYEKLDEILSAKSGVLLG